MLTASLLAALTAPVTLMAARYLVEPQGEFMDGSAPSLAAVALGMFLAGCISLTAATEIASIRTRVTPFEQGLPISRASVKAERAMTAWLLIGAPVLPIALVMLLLGTDWLGVGFFGRKEPWAPTLILWASLTTLAAQAAALLTIHAYRPAMNRLGGRDLAIAVFLSLAVVLVPLLLVPRAAILVYAVVGGVCASIIRSCNQGGADVDIALSQGSAVGALATVEDWVVFKIGALNWVLLRNLVGRPRTLVQFILFPALAVFGAVAGHQSHLLPLIVLFGLISRIAVSRNIQEGLDPLPIARPKIFVSLVLPSLAVILLVVGISSGGGKDRFYSSRLPSRSVWAKDNSGEGHTQVQVPLRLWSWIDGGEPAVVRAPWGETWQPVRAQWAGRKMPLYSPYGNSGANSVRFVRWQLDRATRAGGRAVGSETLAADFMPTEDPSMAVEEARVLGANNANYDLPRGPWFRRLLRVEFLAIILLCGFGVRYVMRSTRPQRPGVRRLLGNPKGHGALLFLPWMAFAMSTGGKLNLPIHVAERALHRLVGGSALGWAALCLATAALLAYWSYRAFLRHETPPQKSWNKSAGGEPVY